MANPHAGPGPLLGNPKCVETEGGAEGNSHPCAQTERKQQKYTQENDNIRSVSFSQQGSPQGGFIALV